MKKAAKFLSLLVSIYLFISLLLSALVSCGIGQWWIIEHRSPFLLVEVCVSTVEGYDEPYQQMYGYDQHGDYIAHDDGREPGETVVSVFLWNPHNNYCDDMAYRFDF